MTRVACWIGTMLGGAAMTWSVVYALTLEGRWAFLYQLALALLCALNLVPASGGLLAWVIPSLPPARRAWCFAMWALPAAVIVAVDVFVVAGAMAS